MAAACVALMAIAAILAARAGNLRAQRSSALDLELGGELKGLPPGSTRFVTREDLLALPQVTYTVTDDSNFTGPAEIKGVLLEELARDLGAAPQGADRDDGAHGARA